VCVDELTAALGEHLGPDDVGPHLLDVGPHLLDDGIPSVRQRCGQWLPSRIRDIRVDDDGVRARCRFVVSGR